MQSYAYMCKTYVNEFWLQTCTYINYIACMFCFSTSSQRSSRTEHVAASADHSPLLGDLEDLDLR